MNLGLFNYEDPAHSIEDSESVILRGLNDAEWRNLLDFVEHLRFPAGARIVQLGDVQRTLFILQSGRVNAVIPGASGSRIIATISAGSVFGELAFFDGAPRSATIVATEAVELLALSQTAFSNLANWHPRIARELLLDLGRVISTRLRRLQARN